MSGAVGLQRVPKEFLSNYIIPVPLLETQEQIIYAIEEEQKIVDANKKLIEIFEQKIKDRIDEVWGVKKEVSN